MSNVRPEDHLKVVDYLRRATRELVETRERLVQVEEERREVAEVVGRRGWRWSPSG